MIEKVSLKIDVFIQLVIRKFISANKLWIKQFNFFRFIFRSKFDFLITVLYYYNYMKKNKLCFFFSWINSFIITEEFNILWGHLKLSLFKLPFVLIIKALIHLVVSVCMCLMGVPFFHCYRLAKINGSS